MVKVFFLNSYSVIFSVAEGRLDLEGQKLIHAIVEVVEHSIVNKVRTFRSSLLT